MTQRVLVLKGGWKMNAKEIEQAASQDQDMPDGLNGAEQMLFLNMRSLHRIKKLGIYNQKSFDRERNKILERFGLDDFNCRMWEQNIKRYKIIEAAQTAVATDKTLMRNDKVADLIYALNGINRIRK